MIPDEIVVDLSRCEEATPVVRRSFPTYDQPRRRRKRQQRYSIKRNGSNAQYKAQDLPFATFPAEAGVLYRAGTEVGGQRCPRCKTYVAVTSKVVRLLRPERGKWWVHERCSHQGESR